MWSVWLADHWWHIQAESAPALEARARYSGLLKHRCKGSRSRYRAKEEEEQKQQEHQIKLQWKRAPSKGSSSKPTKQQKLQSSFDKLSKFAVDAEVAAFFYAEGIPLKKVR